MLFDEKVPLKTQTFDADFSLADWQYIYSSSGLECTVAMKNSARNDTTFFKIKFSSDLSN